MVIYTVAYGFRDLVYLISACSTYKRTLSCILNQRTAAKVRCAEIFKDMLAIDW